MSVSHADLAAMFVQPSTRAIEIGAGVFALRAFTVDECTMIVDQAQRSPMWLAATVNHDLAVDRTIRDADVLYEELHRPYSSFYRERITGITGALAREFAPDTTLKEMQLVRYRAGGRYADHRDSPDRATTPRRVSILCYLDESCTGGETIFPDLDLHVPPVAGVLIAFAPELLHRGDDVLGGTKHVVTAWYHAGEAAG